jgi:NADPH:quinone reductase-like Zn-dependent oxidoreductase
VREGRSSRCSTSVMPLAQAADAHRRIEAREHFGKIVLVP